MTELGTDRLPDILCIGAQKAGTSWLHQILGSHADIWIPPFKEQHLFDHMFLPDHRGWIGPHLQRGYDAARERFEKAPDGPNVEGLANLDLIEAAEPGTMNWYHTVFAPASPDKRAMDVTPEYSGIPPQGIEFIKTNLPGVKLIYIVRDPLERMMSQVRMNVSRRLMRMPGKEINWKWEARNKVVHDRGDYARNIPRWEAAFDREHLMFLPFGMIRSDPMRLLQQVERFVGLQPGDYRGMDRVVHRSGQRELPEEALSILREAAAPQDAFLKTFFDAEFLSMIK